MRKPGERRFAILVGGILAGAGIAATTAWLVAVMVLDWSAGDSLALAGISAAIIGTPAAIFGQPLVDRWLAHAMERDATAGREIPVELAQALIESSKNSVMIPAHVITAILGAEPDFAFAQEWFDNFTTTDLGGVGLISSDQVADRIIQETTIDSATVVTRGYHDLSPVLRKLSQSVASLRVIVPTLGATGEATTPYHLRRSALREATVKLARSLNGATTGNPATDKLEVVTLEAAEIPSTFVLLSEAHATNNRAFVWFVAEVASSVHTQVPVLEVSGEAGGKILKTLGIMTTYLVEHGAGIVDRGCAVRIKGNSVEFAGFRGEMTANDSLPVSIIIVHGWYGSSHPSQRIFLYRRKSGYERDATEKLSFLSGVVSELDVLRSLGLPYKPDPDHSDEYAAGLLAKTLLEFTGDLEIPAGAFEFAAIRECAAKLGISIDKSRLCPHDFELSQPVTDADKHSIVPRLFSLELHRYDQTSKTDEFEVISGYRTDDVILPVTLEELMALPPSTLNTIIRSYRHDSLSPIFESIATSPGETGSD